MGVDWVAQSLPSRLSREELTKQGDWKMTKSLVFITLAFGAAFLSVAATSASAATFALKPVKKNNVAVPANCTANGCFIDAVPGDEIEAELRISNFGPELNGLGGAGLYQARIYGRLGVQSGPNPNGLVLPKGWTAPLNDVDCTTNPQCVNSVGPDSTCSQTTFKCIRPGHNPASGAFITTSNPNFLLFDFTSNAEVSRATLDYLFFALATDFGAGEMDPGGGTEFYGGTYIVQVSPFACGTYTFEFYNTIEETLIGDSTFSTTILPNPLIPMVINLPACGPIKDISDPPHCAIDARRNHPANSNDPEGINSVKWTFDSSTVGMTPDNFTTTMVPAGAPTNSISSVQSMINDLQINLSSILVTNRWTCIEHDASSREHCYGALPGDVNQSSTVSTADVTALIGIIGQSQISAPLRVCDMDRSSRCAPLDLLELINLLNGAENHSIWLNSRMDIACPVVEPR